MKTPSVSTWDAFLVPEGPVLVVLNGPPDLAPLAARLVSELDRRCSRELLHVVADPAWRTWVDALGVGTGQTRWASDSSGHPLEINHFLLSDDMVRWAVSRRFGCYVGLVPHGVYNDQVQEEFESALTILMGEAVLVAHTLPHQYVYLFDSPALFARLGATDRRRRYQVTVRHLLDDLLSAWESEGRPAVADARDHPSTMGWLARHLDCRLTAFDEESGWPSSYSTRDGAGAALARFVALRDRLHQSITHVRERADAVQQRDQALALMQEQWSTDYEKVLKERNEAVLQRDEIIDSLRRRTLTARLRRLFGRE